MNCISCVASFYLMANAVMTAIPHVGIFFLPHPPLLHRMPTLLRSEKLPAFLHAIMLVFASRHNLHAAAQFSSMNPRFDSHSDTDVQKAHSSCSFLLRKTIVWKRR